METRGRSETIYAFARIRHTDVQQQQPDTKILPTMTRTPSVLISCRAPDKEVGRTFRRHRVLPKPSLSAIPKPGRSQAFDDEPPRVIAYAATRLPATSNGRRTHRASLVSQWLS
jgi:hypothetical protein